MTRCCYLSILAFAASTCGLAASARDPHLSILFDSATQRLVVTLENSTGRKLGVFPAFTQPIEGMIPNGVWLQIAEPGASDPARISRWNPVLMSSAALIELPVKLQPMAKKAKLEIVCDADDFISFMKLAKVEGFEEGLWMRFEATYYTEKRLKRRVSVTTEWFEYRVGRVAPLSPEDLTKIEPNKPLQTTRGDAHRNSEDPPQTRAFRARV